MANFIWDDPDEDKPMRPRGLNSQPSDWLFIAATLFFIVSMVVGLILAAVEM